jgi:hypothetical protein
LVALIENGKSVSPGSEILTLPNLQRNLADDDFNVLVIDFHAPFEAWAVNFLHLVDQVFLELVWPKDLQDFMRHPSEDEAFGELVAFFDEVSVEHDDVLGASPLSGSVTMTLRLPRTRPPRETIPSILAISA